MKVFITPVNSIKSTLNSSAHFQEHLLFPVRSWLMWLWPDLFESLWLTVGHCQSNPSQLYLWEHVYGLRLGLTWLNAAESQATSLSLICGGSDCTAKTLKDHTVIFGKSPSLVPFPTTLACFNSPVSKNQPAWLSLLLCFAGGGCLFVSVFLFLYSDVGAQNLSHAANAMSQCLSPLNHLS